MNRKLSIVVTVFTVIISIVLVTFFGLKAEEVPMTIRATDIMFVTKEGGTEEDRYNRRVMHFAASEQVFSIYYFIAPAEASRKDVIIKCTNDEGKVVGGEIVEGDVVIYCAKNLYKDGIIDIDLKGTIIDQFYLTVTSLDNTLLSKTLTVRFDGE